MLSLGRIAERTQLRAGQARRMAKILAANLTGNSSVVAPGGPVVSLTSYGRRIRTVGFTIESIAQGALLPSRLILWLDELAEIRQLPGTLRRLQRRGLEVRATPNYGPHKKYYPFVAAEPHFDVPLTTADDDVLYPRDWLQTLVARHAERPELVHCYRARRIELENGHLAPYAGWPECASSEPSYRHFSVGLAGVLFPPKLLAELKRSGEAFRESCPRADDIWLNLHAQRSGIQVCQVHANPSHFMFVPGTQAVGLLHGNLQGGNDVALRALYTPEDIARLRGN